MHFGPPSASRRVSFVLALACAVVTSACAGRGVFKPEYEYEEELYLALDGSATVNVNASVASLVALRGAELDPDPRARVDRERVRAFFGAPDARVTVSLARRRGRRFVHASVGLDDIRMLSRIPAFAWSAYELDRREDGVEFRQRIGPPVERHAPADAWTGEEIVAFRMHLPSEIVAHNAPSGTIERGNILVWEQALAARLAATPVDVRVQFEPTSILARTLTLFGLAIAAAAMTIVSLLWWVSRRGRGE